MSMLAPLATSRGSRPGRRATTLPSSGAWGIGPIWVTKTWPAAVSSPVGTTFSNVATSWIEPCRSDPQHPVVVPVGHQEPAAVGLVALCCNSLLIARRGRLFWTR